MANKNKRNIFLLLLISMLFIGCSTTEDFGIPINVKLVEFWNGGTMIGRYENAALKYKIATSTVGGIFGSTWYLARYEVTVDGQTEVFIESQTLTLKYVE